MYSIVSQTNKIQIIRGNDSIHITECVFPNELTKRWNMVPNNTAYTRWRCHIGLSNLVKIVSTPQQWCTIYCFWASRPCRPTGWLALLLIKAADVETNPGLTTTPNKGWICDICYRQIHVRKQISIRCNRIEHWVHLRCAGIS